MHIYFSGIGGAGIGPLALIAHQAGYEVSGSDKQPSDYVDYLHQHGVQAIHIGQDEAGIAAVHAQRPIDWFIYSSALPKENPEHPELQFVTRAGIKHSKRDDFINYLLAEKGMGLIAVAGTHGKTTTTAMLVWLFKQLGVPISYSVGAKLSFGDMGEYAPGSKHFIYEADEYDHNFLTFRPAFSLITGIDWDHPDVYPTRTSYEDAFRQFIGQSDWVAIWETDFDKLGPKASDHFLVLDKTNPELAQIKLTGVVNRQNAWQVANAAHHITGQPLAKLVHLMDNFPGLNRRFEALIPGLYTDYAHTPEKIRGALQVAEEAAGGPVVVVYEGLHNTRQHFIKEDLKHLFDDVKQLYVVPSYLAREDPSLKLLAPQDIIGLFAQPRKAQAAALDAKLAAQIRQHLQAGDLVLCLSAGGGGSLDEWLRHQFTA